MPEVTDSTYTKVDSAKVEQLKKMTKKLGDINVKQAKRRTDEYFRNLSLGFLAYITAQAVSKQPNNTQTEIDICMQKETKDYEATKKAMNK